MQKLVNYAKLIANVKIKEREELKTGPEIE